MNDYYDENSKFFTVDINDVNNQTDKPWLKFGSKHSPKEMLSLLNLKILVNFVNSESISFFKTTKEKFDFIFLDGNRSADYVYQDISLSLDILRPNGVILLHDYFLDGKSIWDKKLPILGPYLAVKRIINEKNNIKVVPFKRLPWNTKLNTKNTSLAILIKS